MRESQGGLVHDLVFSQTSNPVAAYDSCRVTAKSEGVPHVIGLNGCFLARDHPAGALPCAKHPAKALA